MLGPHAHRAKVDACQSGRRSRAPIASNQAAGATATGEDSGVVKMLPRSLAARARVKGLLAAPVFRERKPFDDV
jgi:hypothetical protein